MKKRNSWLLSLCAFVLFTGTALPHCEIPCGIYHDQMRVNMIAEDITTIEKAMKQIEELTAQEDSKNFNQIVRWITNKEEHANKIQTTVYQYFMNQRITPVYDERSPEYREYVTQITLLHKMLVSAMKCKQTTDLKHVEDMRELLTLFRATYFGEEALGEQEQQQEQGQQQKQQQKKEQGDHGHQH